MPKRTIQSVARALDILEVLAESKEKTLGELAAAANLHINTARGLTATLMERGYVKQDGERGRYSLGASVIQLGSGLDEVRALEGEMLPLLQELHRQSGEETVYCSRIAGRELIPVAEINGRHALTVRQEPYSTQQIHALAQGKVAMAGWSDGLIRSYIASQGLPKLGPNTITDPEAFFAEIDTVRREGIAYSIDEKGPGLGGVAVPLHNDRGHAVATLAFGVPMVRFLPDQRHRLGRLLLAAVERASRMPAIRKLPHN